MSLVKKSSYLLCRRWARQTGTNNQCFSLIHEIKEELKVEEKRERNGEQSKSGQLGGRGGSGFDFFFLPSSLAGMMVKRVASPGEIWYVGPPWDVGWWKFQPLSRHQGRCWRSRLLPNKPTECTVRMLVRVGIGQSDAG